LRGWGVRRAWNVLTRKLTERNARDEENEETRKSSVNANSGPLPLDVLGFEPFRAFNDLEIDNFPFVQSFEAIAKDGRVVNEYVFTGVLRDEAESLFVVKPFDFAAGHRLVALGQTALVSNALGKDLETEESAGALGFLEAYEPLSVLGRIKKT